VDHWTYNLDLLDSFVAVYCRTRSLSLFGWTRKTFTFYARSCGQPRDKSMSCARVAPSGQMDAVVRDDAKTAASPPRKRAASSPPPTRGPIYRTTALRRCWARVAVKAASLDPSAWVWSMEAE